VRQEKMNAHLLFVATLLVGCLSITAPPIPDVVIVQYTEYLNGVNMFRGTIFYNKKDDLYRSQGLFKDDKELWQHYSFPKKSKRSRRINLGSAGLGDLCVLFRQFSMFFNK